MSRSLGESDAPSVLAVLLECAPHETLAPLLEHALVFMNAFTLLSASNVLLVVGMHAGGSRILWPAGDGAAAAAADALRTAVIRGARELTAPPPGAGAAHSQLAASLALALCRVQRCRRTDSRLQPRVLVIKTSEDDPAQHLQVMNSAFAAKKLGVLIDSVVLAEKDSLQLQQAAFLSGGLHLRADEQAERGLSHYLLSCCLPDQCARRILAPPARGQLETRALCALTKKAIETGWACSVCLSVFGEHKLAACPVCATRFTLQQVRKKKRPASGQASAAARPAPAAAAAPAARAAAAYTLPAPPATGAQEMAAWQREPPKGK
jgi:transcription initiation factor TFIIH subunit 3